MVTIFAPDRPAVGPEPRAGSILFPLCLYSFKPPADAAGRAPCGNILHIRRFGVPLSAH